MIFNILNVVVVFALQLFPVCCLPGKALLGNGAISNVELSSMGRHPNVFGRQPSMEITRAHNANLGRVVSMPKLSRSKSLNLSARYESDGERKNAFVAKSTSNTSSSEFLSSAGTNFLRKMRDQAHPLKQQQGLVPFEDYWNLVLHHFDGKVPTQTIATILCRLVNAFKHFNGNNDYDVITTKMVDYAGILTHANFFAVKQIFVGEQQLHGHAEFIVGQSVNVPKNVQLAYKSPEQLMRKTNISTEADIVWSLGVLLFIMMANQHPLQQFGVEFLSLTHYNMALENATENMEPKWREMIARLMKIGPGVPPFDLKAATNNVGDRDLLIPLVMQCLDFKQEQRISLCRLRRLLEEIVEHIEKDAADN